MSEIKILPMGELGKGFIPPPFLPPGQDEYYLRNRQNPRAPGFWRHLHAEEIEELVKNANTCDDWDLFLVADPFTPHLIKNCEFFGMVRIGKLERVILEHHELKIRAGLTDSLIISCDLGDNVAIHNVRYLAHHIIGNHVMLLNVGEMNTTNHAHFGNGIVKDGEPEEMRLRLDLMNETPGRAVMPFDGMICADAYLWARYRDDAVLMGRLKDITQGEFDSRRGFYGTVGDACVIKNTKALKDVKIGPCCYIKGANKLKNLTIQSTADEPTQIGEGVELVNGIVGRGCHIFYGCKGVRFVIGDNSNLKYGARLIHSFLGDNSTVSCCEILNNLIFPAHEQHHNNSFLIAALLMGQSNLAAGATVGSNHNSRANDGELQAGRGFWPGLCVTLKHPSRFASFVLVAQGDYPTELDIPLPFSLVSNDSARNRLLVMPAYWWMYNMYALARNSWKFQMRDNRKTRIQKIEFEALAPDTAEEIFTALELLQSWTERTAEGEMLGTNLEKSSRPVVILKARQAVQAYRQMLHHYAVKNLLRYWTDHPGVSLTELEADLAGPRQRPWVNLGGQLVPEREAERLRSDIRSQKLNSWSEIHQRYEDLWLAYPREKCRHSLATLLAIHGAERLTPPLWDSSLDEALRIQEYFRDQVYASRKKDYDDPFRRLSFRNAAEMEAVLGTAEDNSFVKQVRAETEDMRHLVARVRQGASRSL